jgi:hypothetical protein
MSPRGSRQKPTLNKVERRVSPDDVRWLEIERDRQAAMDTRTEAERWLGDPRPYYRHWRSEIADRETKTSALSQMRDM